MHTPTILLEVATFWRPRRPVHIRAGCLAVKVETDLLNARIDLITAAKRVEELEARLTLLVRETQIFREEMVDKLAETGNNGPITPTIDPSQEPQCPDPQKPSPR